ncbi:unnamed protein product [Effrenium voratum]|uniref:Uncharacterized protein n=1 Tax=Effrenium voratum TaxID=2562239 RepID=A0AA36J2S3_9DINO|nr:unnamed protein product [Effrenium voratum]CAJ1397449.1 unnamed protein product [Effrenium voratum]CAJ1452066.1 unnamed protein product [Effrenium voratum]
MSGGPHMTMDSGVRHFHGASNYDGIKERNVMVDVDGEMVEVEIDPKYGPRIYKVDGSPPGPNDFFSLPRSARSTLDMSTYNGHDKDWTFYTSTERNICVLQAAKINKCRRALAIQRNAE